MTRMEHSITSDRVGWCAKVVGVVAAHKGIARSALLSPTRSRSEIASARQLAMYLSHVLLELNLTDVGRYFGRDRTTVAHACALIEDAREDCAVDSEIQMLEDQINNWIAEGATLAVEGVNNVAY